ncbi:DUF397 domain-containing protein [Streptomyces sp. NPDC059680]|uniref:DUF397 domain-containing protein n=1 Tax=Streptomyces sp. NPDC059680 TaxID=3346904 RepID=UPI0036B358E7
MQKVEDLCSQDLRYAVWRKSSYSTGTNNCVELADLPKGWGVALRDSKNPARGDLCFTHDEWTAFCAGVRNGDL